MIYGGILAGGKGTRMGRTEMPKQFLNLGNRPMIIHTIEQFLISNKIDKVIKLINEREPDIVVYTGNLINSNYKLTSKEQEMLIKIKVEKLFCSMIMCIMDCMLSLIRQS